MPKQIEQGKFHPSLYIIRGNKGKSYKWVRNQRKHRKQGNQRNEVRLRHEGENLGIRDRVQCINRERKPYSFDSLISFVFFAPWNFRFWELRIQLDGLKIIFDFNLVEDGGIF
jgi:hypothetical protein